MSERVLTIDLGNSRCKLVLWERAHPAQALGHPAQALGHPSQPLGHTAQALGHPAQPLGHPAQPLGHTAQALGHPAQPLGQPAQPLGHPAQPLDEREIQTTVALSIEPFARFVEEWIPRGSGLARIGLSSVAALSGEETVASTLRARFGDRFVERPDPGLDIACAEPEKVGRDRLFAARGALEIVRGAAIVVDAGTALTVDALSVADLGERDLRGRFEGGAIAPGPRLLADALARHAARLPHVDPAPGAHALGRDTIAAVQSGVVVGFRGAARALAREVARESGLEGAPIVVTGGARAFLLQPKPCFDGRIVEDRLLVHRGLLAALDAHVPR